MQQRTLDQETFDVIMFDLEALKDNRRNDEIEKKQFIYHFDLLKGNLQDLFGLTEYHLENEDSYELDIGEKGVTITDGETTHYIQEEIFDEEKHEYRAVDRETEIDNLIQWIGEINRESDKELMKTDLKQLINAKDEYLFSSGNTNDFVLKSEDPKGFDTICEELIKLNEEE